MRYELVVFIVGLVLILLFFPIRFKAKVIYDVFNNKGYISVFFFSLKLFLAKYKINKYKILIKTKKKEFLIDIINESNQISLGEIFMRQMLKIITIKNLRLISHFGFNKDMLVSSLGGASLSITFSIILSLICNNKRIDNYDVQTFNNACRTLLLGVLTGSVQINLFWIIVSFIKSLILKIKKGLVKEYGN